MSIFFSLLPGDSGLTSNHCQPSSSALWDHWGHHFYKLSPLQAYYIFHSFPNIWQLSDSKYPFRLGAHLLISSIAQQLLPVKYFYWWSCVVHQIMFDHHIFLNQFNFWEFLLPSNCNRVTPSFLSYHFYISSAPAQSCAPLAGDFHLNDEFFYPFIQLVVYFGQ